MRAFVFAERGHGVTAIRALIASGVEVVGVCGSAPASRLMLARARLARLIIRDGWPYRDPFEGCAEPDSLGLPFFPREDMGAVVAALDRRQPDLILCCGFPKLLASNVILAAPHAINLHPGLLPERPGGTPNRWAVFDGDGRTGVTAHYMTERFDAGDIVWREEVAFSPTQDWGDVEQMLTPLIERATSFVASRIAGGHDLERRPNPTVRPQPSLRGRRQAIDWTQSGDTIRRLCLACRPKSGAITTRHGRRLVLWSVRPQEYLAYDAAPGTVVSVDDDGLPSVALGERSLQIEQLLIGGRILSAERGRFQVGERLGTV